MANANIFQEYLQRPKSVAEYGAEMDQADQRRQQLQTGALALKDHADASAEKNALRQLFAGGTDLSTAEGQASLYRVAPTQAGAILKDRQGLAKDAAQTKHFDAQSAGLAQDQSIKRHDQHLSAIVAVQSPQDVAQWAQDGLKNGSLTPDQYQRTLQTAQTLTTPEAVQQWKQQAALGGLAIKEQMHQKLEAEKMAQQKTLAANTNATRLQAAGIGAGATLESARMHVGAQTRGQDLTSQTQLTLGGMKPDGTPNTGVESMAQMIAAGKADPISGYALTKPAGIATMQRVAEINPAYDATEYGAKKAAAKAFTTGKEGALLRSIGTATKHLDMLDGLTDALNNGNVQLFNKIGNEFARQTGQPAPTNFDAAKEIVAQEVVKSIVMNGGSMQERQAAAQEIKAANSPKQLHGVVQTYKTIMAAQHESLLQQRDAAGLPRSTLADYGEGAVSPRAVAPAPSRIANDAEYAALPKGARFVAPDGRTGTKR